MSEAEAALSRYVNDERLTARDWLLWLRCALLRRDYVVTLLDRIDHASPGEET